MKHLIKLVIPYTVKYSYNTTIELIFFIMVRRLVDTVELRVYTVVGIFYNLTNKLIYGFIDSRLTVISHTISTGNNYLARQYTQIVLILYTVLNIPFMIL